MKVINEKPPIWADIKKAFDFDERTTIFTYKDAIWNPAGFHVTDDLQVHETVHQFQQAAMKKWYANGSILWWNRYLRDKEFRLEQELQAYRAQYQFVRTRVKNREELVRHLSNMAYALSSPMYGNVIGYAEAIKSIRNNY
jgi:hypothetical protein